MLRRQIQEIIVQNKSPEQAAFKVLEFLDEEIGLAGNGWFDDDLEMKKFLSES